MRIMAVKKNRKYTANWNRMEDMEPLTKIFHNVSCSINHELMFFVGNHLEPRCFPWQCLTVFADEWNDARLVYVVP